MSFVFAPSAFKIVRGTTWADTIQITDEAGNPVDLTSITELLMRVRESIGSATVLLELSIANGRLTVSSAAEGIVTILVSAEDTLELPVNSHERAKYLYDAVIDRGGSPKVIEPGYRGKLAVLPQVTRLLTEP